MPKRTHIHVHTDRKKECEEQVTDETQQDKGTVNLSEHRSDLSLENYALKYCDRDFVLWVDVRYFRVFNHFVC